MSTSWVRALSRVSPTVSLPLWVQRREATGGRGGAGEVLVRPFGRQGRLEGERARNRGGFDEPVWGAERLERRGGGIGGGSTMLLPPHRRAAASRVAKEHRYATAGQAKGVPCLTTG